MPRHGHDIHARGRCPGHARGLKLVPPLLGANVTEAQYIVVDQPPVSLAGREDALLVPHTQPDVPIGGGAHGAAVLPGDIPAAIPPHAHALEPRQALPALVGIPDLVAGVFFGHGRDPTPGHALLSNDTRRGFVLDRCRYPMAVAGGLCLTDAISWFGQKIP